jgi:hypothetical protein
VTWPDSGIILSEPLVRSLNEDQHADLAGTTLTLLDAGFDNEL